MQDSAKSRPAEGENEEDSVAVQLSCKCRDQKIWHSIGHFWVFRSEAQGFYPLYQDNDGHSPYPKKKFIFKVDFLASYVGSIGKVPPILVDSPCILMLRRTPKGGVLYLGKWLEDVKPHHLIQEKHHPVFVFPDVQKIGFCFRLQACSFYFRPTWGVFRSLVWWYFQRWGASHMVITQIPHCMRVLKSLQE